MAAPQISNDSTEIDPIGEGLRSALCIEGRVTGLNSLADAIAAGLVCTAIPRGTRWAVKVQDAGGASLFGSFPCRAEALRTATCLAEMIGGRAVV